MKKFVFKYLDKSDDLCSVIVHGNSKEEAKANFRNEYWDITDIVSVTEYK